MHVMKCHDSSRWPLPSLCCAAVRNRQTILSNTFFCTPAFLPEAALPARGAANRGPPQTAARRKSDFVHIMFSSVRQALFCAVSVRVPAWEFLCERGRAAPPPLFSRCSALAEESSEEGEESGLSRWPTKKNSSSRISCQNRRPRPDRDVFSPLAPPRSAGAGRAWRFWRCRRRAACRRGNGFPAAA